jgi:hypothetical protein
MFDTGKGLLARIPKRARFAVTASVAVLLVIDALVALLTPDAVDSLIASLFPLAAAYGLLAIVAMQLWQALSRHTLRFSVRTLVLAIMLLCAWFASTRFSMRSNATEMLFQATMSVPFYALLFQVALWLRRPAASALAWILIRAAFQVPVAIGSILRSERALSLLALSAFLDAPITPLLDGIHHLHGHIHNRHLWRHLNISDVYGVWHLAGTVLDWIDTASQIVLRLAWYGGGGYLAGRWAREGVVAHRPRDSQAPKRYGNEP